MEAPPSTDEGALLESPGAGQARSNEGKRDVPTRREPLFELIKTAPTSFRELRVGLSGLAKAKIGLKAS